MPDQLPAVVTLAAESLTRSGYNNHAVAKVNDHVVRLSIMVEPYFWHSHPNSDETFLVVEERLAIDFEDGSIELAPGQLLTVPRGLRHRTRPVGASSVNLTFELAQAHTVPG